MAWSAPHNYSVSEVVTAADMNAMTGNDAFLYGDLGWTAPVYTNSWTDIGPPYLPVGFRLVGTRVVMQGIMHNGTGMVSAFVLPVGYRPTANLQMSTVSNSLWGFVIIGSNGSVVPTAGSTASFSFDGMSFDTV